MYSKFYGFKEKPFNLTPDSRFFYASAKHEEALNCLLLAISERNGFVVVTGEIGAGKTTVCRTLLNKLDPATKVALILNTHLTKKELLITILDDLGIEYKTKSKAHLLWALNKYLIEQAHNEVNVVLIIDEAQNLTTSVIEEVRMLSNLETEREKLIQIVLIGQPELRKKLANPKLEQFRQRVVFHYHLQALDFEETNSYIKHRLVKAGNKEADTFTQPAIAEIFNYSKGVPRLINLVCHNALIGGLVADAKTISLEIVKEAIREITSGLGHVFISERKKSINKLKQAEEASPKQFNISETKHLTFLNNSSDVEDHKFDLFNDNE